MIDIQPYEYDCRKTNTLEWFPTMCKHQREMEDMHHGDAVILFSDCRALLSAEYDKETAKITLTITPIIDNVAKFNMEIEEVINADEVATIRARRSFGSAYRRKVYVSKIPLPPKFLRDKVIWALGGLSRIKCIYDNEEYRDAKYKLELYGFENGHYVEDLRIGYLHIHGIDLVHNGEPFQLQDLYRPLLYSEKVWPTKEDVRGLITEVLEYAQLFALEECYKRRLEWVLATLDNTTTRYCYDLIY